MRRLFGLALIAVGWLALRRRQQQPGSGQAGPGQLLAQGKQALSSAAESARPVLEQVQQRVTQAAGAAQQKVQDARGAGSSDPAPAETLGGMPSTQQPPDDSLLVGQGASAPEAFAQTAPPVAGPSTYASASTGPEDAATNPDRLAPAELAGDTPMSAGGGVTSAYDTETFSPGATIAGGGAAMEPSGQEAVVFDAEEADASVRTGTPAETTVVSSGTADATLTTQTTDAASTTGSALPLTGTGMIRLTSSDADTAGEAVVREYTTETVETGTVFGDSGATPSPAPQQGAPAGGGDEAEEGLLLEPDEGASGTTGSASAMRENAAVIQRTDAGGSGGASPEQRRTIEGGSGVGAGADRIYGTPHSSQPGPEDTEDTATDIGAPGPVANARREELRSLNIAPPGIATTEDYQKVEVSLPPETLQAMEQGQTQQAADPPVREGYDVEATDGKVGAVDGTIPSRPGAEGYLVVKAGLLFKTDVNIPFSAVQRVQADTVYLNIDKQYVKLMEGQETPRTGGTPGDVGGPLVS